MYLEELFNPIQEQPIQQFWFQLNELIPFRCFDHCQNISEMMYNQSSLGNFKKYAVKNYLPINAIAFAFNSEQLWRSAIFKIAVIFSTVMLLSNDFAQISFNSNKLY
jgi:hypothetical protein